MVDRQSCEQRASALDAGARGGDGIGVYPIANTLIKSADRRVREMLTKLGALYDFVDHRGEAGRAHELILRDAIRPFLRPDIRIGSGFLYDDAGASPQQDVLLYGRCGLPTLYEIGDVAVVDRTDAYGTIEVKTAFDAGSELKPLFDLHARTRSYTSTALFAFDGSLVTTTLNKIWELVREDPHRRRHDLPTALFVLDQFLLIFHGTGDALATIHQARCRREQRWTRIPLLHLSRLGIAREPHRVDAGSMAGRFADGAVAGRHSERDRRRTAALLTGLGSVTGAPLSIRLMPGLDGCQILTKAVIEQNLKS